MVTLGRRSEPSFHLQAGAALGATVGLVVGAVAPRTFTVAAMAVAAVAFAFWFRGSLWPLLSKKRFYESFFGIPGPGPLTYVKEGAAGGGVAGAMAGLALGLSLATLLAWTGLALLLIRYRESLAYLLAGLRGQGSGPAYGRLLTRVQGDRGVAERLMAYEGRHGPPGSREDLAERALERLERDSR